MGEKEIEHRSLSVTSQIDCKRICVLNEYERKNDMVQWFMIILAYDLAILKVSLFFVSID